MTTRLFMLEATNTISALSRRTATLIFALTLLAAGAIAQDRVDRAIELLRDNQLSSARALLEAVLREDPGDARAGAYLALAEIQAGDFQVAARRLHTLLEADPANADLRVLLADAYQQNRDWAFAEQQWRAVLAQRPNSEQAHIQLGTCLLQQNRFEDGLAAVERGLQINPRRADGHALKGNILAALDRAEEAYKSWNQALALDVNNPAALAGLAVYLRDREPDFALEYARRAVELSRWEATGPVRILVLVHRARGELAQARQVLEKALTHMPDNEVLQAELNSLRPAAPAPAPGASNQAAPPPPGAPLGDVARYNRARRKVEQPKAPATQPPK